MQIFDNEKIYDFMSKKLLFFVLSLIFLIGSIFLLTTRGLNYGIDFAGGTLIQIRYDKPAPLDEIRAKFDTNEILKNASVTEFGSSEEVVIRYPGSSDNIGSNPAATISEILNDTGKFEVRRVDVVGPKVGNELREKGIMALSVSLVLILIYIAFRFEWRFAIAAILSEIHDVLIALGFISLLRIDVNLDTLAAILTIIGYSLNDTIIVFDRIREGIRASKSNEVNRVINESISATLSRTIMTSITTLLTVLTLFFFGGDMIHGFSTIMMIGVIVGTFSSIFIAAPMLIWFKFDIPKYRANLSEIEKRKKEKEKLRAMYEKGTV